MPNATLSTPSPDVPTPDVPRPAAPTAVPSSAPVRTARRRGADPAAAVLVVACAAVLVFWWTTTPPAFGTSPGGALTAVGDLAGLLCSVLVCAQLLLVARIPWFERAVGHDRLVGRHRTLGTTVLLLVLTHVLLVVVGGALSARRTVWSQAWSMLWNLPDLVLATSGTVLFLAAGLTSARLLRRRLSYEWWFVIHLGTYLGIYLTFWHQLADGAQLGTSPGAQTVWKALYLGTFVVLVVWRVLVPLRRLRRHALRVAAVVDEGGGLVSVWVEGRAVEALEVRGGQFFLVRFLTPGHRTTSHPYSVSTVPAGDRLRFTIGALGDHSSAAARVRPGTRVLLEGPFGRFTADRARRHGVLLVAGGAGIGPVRALAEDLVARGHDVVVLHRARTPEGLALGGELTAATRYVPLPGRRADLGYDPLAVGSVGRLVPDVAERDVFVCGPEPMVDAFARTARALGVPRSAVHFEELSLS